MRTACSKLHRRYRFLPSRRRMANEEVTARAREILTEAT